MYSQNRKIVLVGTGLVGMSYAYALLNQNVCDELVLVDIDKRRALGEAMDLNHGLAFSGSNMKIYAGSYEDCKDATIVTICAGIPRKPEDSRLDLLQKNTSIFKSIIPPIVASGFIGIFLVVSNPVDILAHITYTLSGFPRNRVIGSGTTLDTARLRYMLGDYFEVDSRNVHTYVMGEHGDSEFVPWSQALIATKPLLELCSESDGEYCYDDMVKISDDVKSVGKKIIESKKSSYYGIGMAMVRVTKAILGNENCVLTVSAMLDGEYGRHNVYSGVPCIVNRKGIDRIITLSLTNNEIEQFNKSCDLLESVYNEINL